MNSDIDAFTYARQELGRARRAARVIGSSLQSGVPANLDEALRLQHAVATDLGAVRGWKISGLTTDQQREMGVDSPLSAPLLVPWFRESGQADFTLANFIRPRLECEFAFELSRDLPARDVPYTRDEIEAAIAGLRIGVEVVDSRLPPDASPWLQLADDLNNGAFVVGRLTASWQHINYAANRIALRHKSSSKERELAQGSGLAILEGDPVSAVLLLANLPAHVARKLMRGHIITTGSCTGAIDVPATGDYEADFGALGTVQLRFTA